MQVSKNTLKLLAAFVWYAGGVILALKSYSLVKNAVLLEQGHLWPSLAILSGIILGLIKAKFLFNKACRKNLIRISELKTPMVWNFYRIPFYFSLTAMIMLGKYLSATAQGNYSFLLSVAILDISIGTALLVSSHIFWKKPV